VHGWVKLVDAQGREDNHLHKMSFDAVVKDGYADVELLLKDRWLLLLQHGWQPGLERSLLAWC
jgi:hypothetical protein